MPNRQNTHLSDGSSGATITAQPPASPSSERMTRSRVSHFAAQTDVSKDDLLDVNNAGNRRIDDLLRGMRSATDSAACSRAGSQEPQLPKGSEELLEELDNMAKDEEEKTGHASKKPKAATASSSKPVNGTKKTDDDEQTAQPDTSPTRHLRPWSRSGAADSSSRTNT